MDIGSSTMESSCPCYIESLPDELILLVLGYLNIFDATVASHVCRRWRSIISFHTLLVRRPSDAHHASTTQQQLFISARGTDLSTILNTTCRLHTLIMHVRVPLENSMLTTLRELRHLMHLDIFTVSSQFSSHLIPTAQRLSTMVINDMLIRTDVLKALTQSSRLTQLHMFGFLRIYEGRKLVELIASRQQYLTELTLRAMSLPDSGYQEISRCHNLVALRLYSCYFLRPETALNMFSGLNKLRVLHLTGKTMLWKKGLRNMINVLPKSLEELSLSGSLFDDDHVRSLASRLLNLRILELWRTPISSQALVMLAEILPKLKELDVDKIFTIRQLKALVAHPSLIKLRCCRPPNMWTYEFQKIIGHLAPVATPQAQYASSSFRSDGDGFRSLLFYHWSVEFPPRPLSYCGQRSAINSDYDDDYSLLGPEIMSCSSDLKRSYEDAAMEDPVNFSP